MIKAILITNFPAPYREKVYEKISSENINFLVLYVKKHEKGRKWLFKQGDYKKIFLHEFKKSKFNIFKLWHILNFYSPDVVITTGFSYNHLISIIWTKLFSKKHICFTDGWEYTVNKLSFIHKLLRKLIYVKSNAFIGPSDKTLKMFKTYGAYKSQLFKSHLCVSNQKYFNYPNVRKKYDLMFSGQFIERKMPYFFIDICYELKKKYNNLSVLILGDGKLKTDIMKYFELRKIDFYYPGFVQQQDLPKYYKQSKIFLFPTKFDPWGVVANEACASGLPVITTSFAGVADEIVIHKYNGYILDVDVKLWVQYIDSLLSNEHLYNTFANNSLQLIKPYNELNASKGIKDAINYVFMKTKKNKK
jgi:glycosyltransferase involved in cell wall biosynthesis